VHLCCPDLTCSATCRRRCSAAAAAQHGSVALHARAADDAVHGLCASAPPCPHITSAALATASPQRRSRLHRRRLRRSRLRFLHHRSPSPSPPSHLPDRPLFLPTAAQPTGPPVIPFFFIISLPRARLQQYSRLVTAVRSAPIVARRHVRLKHALFSHRREVVCSHGQWHPWRCTLGMDAARWRHRQTAARAAPSPPPPSPPRSPPVTAPLPP
jgi:hypothetical protein